MTFHRLIAQATHNEIIAHIIHDLTALLQQTIHEVHAGRLMASRSGALTHQSILDTFSQRDSEKAAALMQEHLAFAKEMWQTVISVSTASKP